ncbi:MAG: peptidase [Deinococcus sp.]|nr:peptidase [Deinococcus sp.]
MATLFLGAACSGAAGAAGGSGGPTPDSAAIITVQPGDTAYALARRAGLSVEALLALNGLKVNAAGGVDLRAGQVLRIQELPPHVVQPGETLYALARRYGLTVDALLAANGLGANTVLNVGQSLRLSLPLSAPVAVATPTLAVPAASGGVLPVSHPAPAALPNPTAVVGWSAAASAPAVPSVLVAQSFAPQDQNQGPQALPDALPTTTTLPSDWRGAALALLGTPYAYGGASRAGTDCSGFVLQVFTPLGVQLPRRSADQAQTGLSIDSATLLPGDLVFFDTEGRGAVTHVGIYLGEDSFVSANSYRGQVSVDKLMSDRYWAPRYLGARRVLPEHLAYSH